jgi:hypothetical protein
VQKFGRQIEAKWWIPQEDAARRRQAPLEILGSNNNLTGSVN